MVVTICGGAEVDSAVDGGGGKTVMAVGHSVTVTVTVTSVCCVNRANLAQAFSSLTTTG